MTVGSSGAADRASAGALSVARGAEGVDAPWARFACECFGPDGALKWREEFDNVVTTEGKQLNLNVTFGATAKPTWYVLLKGTGAAAAGHTLGTHAGWTEVAAYTGNRPTISFGASTVFSTTGAQVTNGTAATFAINADNTVIAGAGVCTAATGTTGTLYNIGDFASSRTMGNGDSLNVTVTLRQNPEV